MLRFSRTQPTKPAETTQPVEIAFSAESTVSKFARKPNLTMVWMSETVGDRTRLIARWTTQD